VHPWHLKVSFQLLDDKSTVTDSGLYEEFWAGAELFKRTYTGHAFKVAEFGTSGGVKSSGDRIWPSWALNSLRDTIVAPLPNEADLEKSEFQTRDVKAARSDKGRADLVCFTVKDKPTAFTKPLFPKATYCFDSHDPFLRTRGIYGEGLDSTSNDPTVFHDRWIPRDIALLHGGKLMLTAHVETIEELSRIEDASSGSLSADSSSPQPDTVGVPSETAEGLLISHVPPVYPAIAKAARIKGTVVLQVLIGKDGKVKELGVESGPPLLQQAALDAVSRWVYRPYLVNGKPKPVFTKVNVIFKLE